ncbi:MULTISPECIES: BrnA antitoxin family protein [Thiorhodovibrio]|uniref:BrnA antitoxin family protein n=1 Tax=Thiorhodovibrio TaxID=61593 RepID=UPI001A9369A6|nr:MULTISPECIES: BrnA antitoxin family protein [Thiorhodovibrio]MBK5968251.1 hypothetical protein [Thiorhodovibrio winogradskyi]
MIDAAPEEVAFDPDSPPTQPEDWQDAVFVPGGGYHAVKSALAERRRTRDAQKAPTKVFATVRFDADVLEGLRATGDGWQTRVNDAMRDWLRSH